MLLLNYLNEIGLPNVAIGSCGKIGRAFLKENVLTLWDAIEYVHQLPYARTTDRENYLQVLTEKRGACSAKHALIAALGEELSIPLTLTLGFFLLTAKNTPKIVPILEHYHLKAIPESHCYLKYRNNTLDITFPDSSAFLFNVDIEEEMDITPQHIGLFKVEKHQAFIRTWIKDKAELNFDLIWAAREQWILALSNGM